MNRATLHRTLIFLAAALLLPGCGGVMKAVDKINPFSGPETTDLDELQVVAEPDANRTSATALDLVFVLDELVPSLLPASGPKWFEQRDALLRRFAGKIKLVSLEIPPGTAIASVDLPKDYDDAVKVLAYANYLSPKGQPVIDLTWFEEAALRLKKETITYYDREAKE